jgi:hypothetical protein
VAAIEESSSLDQTLPTLTKLLKLLCPRVAFRAREQRKRGNTTDEWQVQCKTDRIKTPALIQNAALSMDARRQLEELADPVPIPMDIDSSTVDALDVLDGSATVDLSHAGRELKDLVDDISQDPNVRKRRRDQRTRRDRVLKRVAQFDALMPFLIHKYQCWSMGRGDKGYNNLQPDVPEGSSVKSQYKICVLDLFGEFACACCSL